MMDTKPYCSSAYVPSIRKLKISLQIGKTYDGQWMKEFTHRLQKTEAQLALTDENRLIML